MSRKDGRKVLALAVDREVLAAARAARRPGRSLSDVLRRALVAAAARPYVDFGARAGADARVLSVQLPPGIRARLSAAARATGRDAAHCALQDLHASLRAGGVAQAAHVAVEPDPDRCRGPDP